LRVGEYLYLGGNDKPIRNLVEVSGAPASALRMIDERLLQARRRGGSS
jgi:hypothetical protein